MSGALLLMTIGGILVYSSLKGLSIVDVVAGKTGDTLDPHGGSLSDTADTGAIQDFQIGGKGKGDYAGLGGDWTAPPGGAHSFKGPNSVLLNTLAGIAQNTYHLTITATTNGGHVPGSYHYSGRAFDSSGSEADMRAFAKYVQDTYGSQILELIHNPGFAIKDGKNVNGAVVYAAVWAGHRDHVHVAA